MDHTSPPSEVKPALLVDPSKPVAMCTVAELVAAVVAELRGPAGDTWINQSRSAAGRGRHCAEVRRLVAAVMPGARIIGRSFELSPEAYGNFVATLSRGKLPKAPVAPESSAVVDELKAQLRMIGARK